MLQLSSPLLDAAFSPCLAPVGTMQAI